MPVYYLSKKMLEYELNYTQLEKTCLTLVWATQRLRHYLLSQRIILISRMDQMKYLFEKPALIGRTTRWLLLLSEFEITYVTQKSVKSRIIAEQLADAHTEDTELRCEFSDEGIMTIRDAPSDTTWTMYFAKLQTQEVEELTLFLSHLGMSTYEFLLNWNLTAPTIWLSTKLAQPVWKQPYHWRFADALGTLASMVDIPVGVKETPTEVSLKEKRALQKLTSRYVICGGDLYHRSFDGVQLLCVDEDRAAEILEDVHSGVCGPHMNGKMLARKILRLVYFWTTLEADCFSFVRKCHLCQIHANLIHVPPSELHSLTSPWPFSVWGFDIIGKISPKSSSGHEYILIAIYYFTKWIEAQSYASISSASVFKFIRANLICRYGVPHELISDNGSHFKKEIASLCEEFKIKHHNTDLRLMALSKQLIRISRLFFEK
ncbi:uncharacterized protein LOC143856039 [Tasmannia lanceolata]|uniref:uncharacterized protein LOC143856039 n=1 Tax=Tasmannia lanceolata TaxID=3420 RepID=UPI004063D03B